MREKKQFTHTHTHAHTHACNHTYTHTHMHAHTHTQPFTSEQTFQNPPILTKLLLDQVGQLQRKLTSSAPLPARHKHSDPGGLWAHPAAATKVVGREPAPEQYAYASLQRSFWPANQQTFLFHIQLTLATFYIFISCSPLFFTSPFLVFFPLFSCFNLFSPPLFSSLSVLPSWLLFLSTGFPFFPLFFSFLSLPWNGFSVTWIPHAHLSVLHILGETQTMQNEPGLSCGFRSIQFIQTVIQCHQPLMRCCRNKQKIQSRSNNKHHFQHGTKDSETVKAFKFPFKHTIT